MRLLSSIFLCLIVSTSFSKDPVHKVFGEYSSIILKASSIKVYKIQQYPVVATEQEKKTLYIYDYGVTRIFHYDDINNLDSLTNYLMDTTQFLYEDRRMCPFVGKVAVEFTKGRQKLTLVFSEQPCYKVIIFCPGTDIDKTHLDLGENNRIYDTLLKLSSDKM